MAYIDKLLADDEDVLVYSRQHGIVVVFDVLKRIFTLLVLAALMFGVQAPPLLRFINNERLLQPLLSTGLWDFVTRYVQIGCLILMGIVLILIVVDYLRWTATVYVLTDRRVLAISGIVNKRSFDSSLNRINDVQLDQSWLGQMFNYGDLVILTAADQGANALRSIIDPLDFKRSMQAAKQDHERPRTPYTPAPAQTYARGDQSVSQALHTLLRLREQNLLSAEEFEEKKRELLRRL